MEAINTAQGLADELDQLHATAIKLEMSAQFLAAIERLRKMAEREAHDE